MTAKPVVSPDVVIPYKERGLFPKMFEIVVSMLRQREDVGKIFTIGDPFPGKYASENTINIPFESTGPSTSAFKQDQITQKTLLACTSKHISNPFILMDDDMVVCKDYTFGIYRKYDLSEEKLKEITDEKSQIDNDYTLTLIKTRDYLLSLKRKTWNFECHHPILIHKKKFISSCRSIEGLACRSVYGNTFFPDSEEVQDAKSALELDIPLKETGIVSPSNDNIKRTLVKTLGV
jgi:hypothetical protein